jgi:hypothetical protein
VFPPNTAWDALTTGLHSRGFFAQGVHVILALNVTLVVIVAILITAGVGYLINKLNRS